MNPLDPFLSKKDDYTDGKYSVHSFSSTDAKFKRIVCKSESICIIPFDLNDKGEIRNVYLAKYKDHLNNQTSLTCIFDSFDRDQFDSYFESVEDCLEKEIGFKDVDINDIYYLGKVNHSIPFSKEFRCYAVDLSKYSDDPAGYSSKPVDLYTVARGRMIEKVKFTKVLKGDIPDSLVLSASLLLLSQFSE